MALTHLAVRDFRNIAAADLALSPQLNLVTGNNGAGKTSLLEAVYFLGRAQSFRTSHPTSLIREGTQALLLRGRLEDASGAVTMIGVQRDQKQLQVRMGARPVRHLAELIAHFPFQLLTPDSHHLLDGGPRYRRRFLDWGVFHVEPAFFPTWQRYSRALRQRNAALRARVSVREIQLWDGELVAATDILEAMRRAYLDRLLPILANYVTALTDMTGMTWEYRTGWARKQTYQQALQDGLEGDRRQGFTRQGPHRADLVPTIEGEPAQERISRGQQKQIAVALMLAQAAVYRLATGRASLFLIDDLASELDTAHCGRVLRHLRELEAQVFLTAIEPGSIETQLWSEPRRFHVEHGRVEE